MTQLDIGSSTTFATSSKLSSSSVFSYRPVSTQNVAERGAELAVEDGIDKRIKSRVAVTESENHSEQSVWNVEVEGDC